MDWQALASITLERCAEPMVVLSREGRIVLANRPFVEVFDLGIVAGRLASEIWQWASPNDGPDDIVAASFRGIVDKWECVVRRTSLERMRMFVDVRRFGPSGDEALFGIVRELHSESVFTPNEESVAYYEVAMNGDASASGAAVLPGPFPMDPPSAEGRDPCHQVLYGRPKPCDDCPLLATELPWPRIGVRAPNDPKSPWLLLVAEHNRSSIARVWFHVISESTLSNIVRAKVSAVVRNARLTDREHEVLQMMLVGRGPEEIATVLALASRTVRFHQRNILEKIGADSKFDLLRMLL